jgi:hypothetical protein
MNGIEMMFKIKKRPADGDHAIVAHLSFEYGHGVALLRLKRRLRLCCGLWKER